MTLLLSGLLGAALSGCTQVKGEVAAPARPVRAAAATRAPADAGVRYSATIEPFSRVSLAFKTSGYVDQVLTRRSPDGRVRSAQPGDAVARGTVLARVRETEARQRVAQARARLGESEAALSKARLDMDRAATLFAADSLTRPELDAARAALDGADARVRAATADVALAEVAVRDGVLMAPSAGVILERGVERGSLATPGAMAFVVGDLEAVKARFGVPDSMIQSIALGQVMRVTVDALAGAAFEGRLTGIAPAADAQSRVFDVEVTIPNADGRLRPGMIGTVMVGERPVSPDAAPLTVPLTAVVRGDASGAFAVFVVERASGTDVVRRRAVDLGDVRGNAIIVTRGLTTTERVVVSGATLLRDGDTVQIVQ